MSKHLSERELYNLFQQNLPPVEIPAELAARLEARMLAEVALTIKAAPFVHDAHSQAHSAKRSTMKQGARSNAQAEKSNAGSRRAFGNWPKRLGLTTSLTLAGATLAALLFFTLMLPKMLPPQTQESITGAGAEEILAPAPVLHTATADIMAIYGDVLLQHGSSGAVTNVPVNARVALAEGDIIQVDNGRAELDFPSDQRIILEPHSRIRIVELQVAVGAGRLVFLQETGTTRHSSGPLLNDADRYEVRTTSARTAVNKTPQATEFVVTVIDIDETVVQALSGTLTIESATGRTAAGTGDQVIARASGELIVQAAGQGDTAGEELAAAPQQAAILPPSTRSMQTDTPGEAAAGAAQPPGATDPFPTPTPSAEETVTETDVAQSRVAEPKQGASSDGAMLIVAPTPGQPSATAAAGDRSNARSPSPSVTPHPASLNAASVLPTPTSAPTNRAVTTRTPYPSATPAATATSAAATNAAATSATVPSAIVTPTRINSATPAPTQPTAVVVEATATNAAITAQPVALTPAATATPLPTMTRRSNQPPVAAADTAATVEEQAIAIPVLANDYDADQEALIVVGLTQPAYGRATNNGNGTVTYTPNADYSGVDRFTYRLSDGTDIRTGNVTITIAPVNDPPRLNALDDLIMAEDASSVVNLSVTDVDTPLDQLRVAVRESSNQPLFQPADLNVTGDGAMRRLTLRPLPERAGATTLTVSVSDGELQVQRTFRVTIQPVNDPPTMGPIADQAIAKNSAGAVNIALNDVDNADTVLTLTTQSSNQALLPADNLQIEGDGAMRTLRFAPIAERTGAATITVTASDGQAVATRSFSIVVEAPANQAPEIAPIADQSTPEDSAIDVSIQVADADSPAATLIIEATAGDPSLLAPGELSVSGSNGTRVLRIAPAADRTGSTLITVRADDGLNQSQASFMLTILPVNDPPTINGGDALPNQSSGEDERHEIAFSIADPDTAADALTVNAAADNSALLPPEGLTISGSGASRTLLIMPAANQSGAARITLTVGDGERQTQSAFTFTVTPRNDAPSLTAPDEITLDEETTRDVSVGVNDPDNASEELEIVVASDNETLLPADSLQLSGSGQSRTLRIAPAANRSGEAIVTVTVSDGELQSRRALRVTVINVNDAPTLGSIADIELNEDDTRDVQLMLDDSDSDVDALTVRAQVTNPESATLFGDEGLRIVGSGRTRILKVTPQPDQSGVATIAIIVSDGQAQHEQRFDVTVQPVNDPPTAVDDAVVHNRADAVDESILVRVLDNDDDDNPDRLRINEVSAPSHGKVAVDGNAIRYTPDAAFSGQETFAYTISDGEYSAAAEVTITVE